MAGNPLAQLFEELFGAPEFINDIMSMGSRSAPAASYEASHIKKGRATKVEVASRRASL
jgi:hypothetical protein